ncbi:MAG: 3'-5' exonuclease [Streptosporangiaceae bacterium]
MAQLYVGSEFLPEYARLERVVRTLVDDAIAKFASHTHAGLHLEKITDSRDSRIRTIRIDAFWRGLVLAPDSGDSYCLIRVLPHDDAIAYAKSHRFSANQAIGVLEVRDEQAIEREQADLRASAAGAESPLFAHVSDADLARLGVDAAILPVVRLLLTAEQLDAMQSMLPEVQFVALYSLACGMTVDQTWEQVCQYAPADTGPVPVDPDDLTSALGRTPGRVAPVSGPEELREILAHPFATWRTFLQPSQRAIARQPSYAGPAQVTGGAGTGKTVTALHRTVFLAQRLAHAGRGTPGRPEILLTTFTTGLADALDAQLAMLAGNDLVRSRIEVINIDKLANRVVRTARGGTLPIAAPDALRERFAAAAADAGADAADLSASFLEHEWEQVIIAQDLADEQAYLDCHRSGRGRPLTRAQRGVVWRIVQRVTGELAGAGEMTYLQVTAEAARLLTESGPLYLHVVVDEGQDLNPAQWRLLRAAVAAGPDDLFIAADPYQRIYDNRVSLASLGIGVRGRTRRLMVNYRTTAQVLNWAVPILGTAPVTGLDDQAASLLGYRSPISGQRPEVRGTPDRESELAALAERIAGWIDAGIEPHAIGVAARSGSLAKEAKEALKARGIPTLALTTRSPKSAVRVGTMHGMKGLEFQAVAVIGVQDGSVPAASALTNPETDPVAHAQDLQRERCVLFVACTRARDHLYVSFAGRPSPFLPG